MRRRYLISGYYGYRNSGDEALLKSVLATLRDLDPNCHITVLSKNKKDYRFKVDNVVNRFNLFSLINAIASSDILIMGGGSLLQDKTSNRSLYYYLFVIHLATLYGKKTYMYANGVGPIDGDANRRLTKKVLDKLSMIVLRDEKSKILLDDMGVQNSNIFVTADPVYGLEKFEYVESKENKNVVMILRNWENFDRISDELAQFADYLIEEKGKSVLFMPLMRPNDNIATQKVKSKMKNESEIVKADEFDSVKKILLTCSHCYSMRLHGVVYSGICSIPLIGLSYDMKVKSNCEKLNMPYIDIDEISFQKLCEINQDLDNNYNKLKNALRDNIIDLSHKASMNQKILNDFIISDDLNA